MFKKLPPAAFLTAIMSFGSFALANNNEVSSSVTVVDQSEAWSIESLPPAATSNEQNNRNLSAAPASATIPKFAHIGGMWGSHLEFPQVFIQQLNSKKIMPTKKLESKRIQKKWSKKFINALTDEHYDTLYSCLLAEHKQRGKFSQKSDFIAKINEIDFTIVGGEFDLNSDGSKDLLFWVVDSEERRNGQSTPLFQNNCNYLRNAQLSTSPFFVLLSNKTGHHIAFYGYVGTHIFLAQDTYTDHINSTVFTNALSNYKESEDTEAYIEDFQNKLKTKADAVGQRDYYLVATTAYVHDRLDLVDLLRRFEFRQKPVGRSVSDVVKFGEYGFYDEYKLVPETGRFETHFSLGEFQEITVPSLTEMKNSNIQTEEH